jgi:hypothetical protein
MNKQLRGAPLSLIPSFRETIVIETTAVKNMAFIFVYRQAQIPVLHPGYGCFVNL